MRSLSRALARPAILATLLAGLGAGSLPMTGAASGAAVTIYPDGQAGLASAQPARIASHTAARRPSALGSKGARIGRHGRAAATTTSAATSAQANGSNVEQGNGTLGSHFNGVSSVDSAVTNFGAEFQPPDQGLCVGNGYVLEPVNSAYRIYRTNGTSIAGPFNVNDLFAEGPAEYTSDPRCYYDPTTNTWFAIIVWLATNPDGSFGNTSHVDLSVNPSGNPTTSWKTYQIDTSDPGGPGCGCFGDQPRIGIDAYNVYLSTDEFSINGTEYNGPQLYAVAKQDLVALRSQIHYVHFANLTIAGMSPVAVEPAITNGAADAEYFLNSLDPTGTTDNRIGVWAMTNQGAVARGRSPRLSSVVFNSETYGVPPKAAQKGSVSLLDSGDDRMQQTQFINGTIWGELDTAVNVAGDPVQRAGAAWFNVRPELEGRQLAGATMSRQGYVAVRGNYLLYPAIQADSNGNAAMVVTLTSPNRFPSAAYASLTGGQSRPGDQAASRSGDKAGFGPVRVAAAGFGPYDPDGTRWGDYSWAQWDQATDSIWMATEYIPPPSSQTADGNNNWGTEVLQVKFGGD